MTITFAFCIMRLDGSFVKFEKFHLGALFHNVRVATHIPGEVVAEHTDKAVEWHWRCMPLLKFVCDR